MKLEHPRQIFEKYTNYKNNIKILSMGADLFRADGQTDMTKLKVAFRNYAKAPKIPFLTSPERCYSTLVGYNIPE
jgi:hypothetical protein